MKTKVQNLIKKLKNQIDNFHKSNTLQEAEQWAKAWFNFSMAMTLSAYSYLASRNGSEGLGGALAMLALLFGWKYGKAIWKAGNLRKKQKSLTQYASLQEKTG